MLLAADFGLFLGRFHPLVVHLPIGILLLGFLLKWRYRTNTSEGMVKAISTTFFWGAVSAILAAFLGWQLGADGGYDPNTLFWHQWTGISVAVIASLLWWTHRPSWTGSNMLRNGLMAGAVLLLTITGHLGGVMTHGENYLFQYAPGFLNSNKELSAETAAIPVRPDSVIAYAHLVQPILEEKCFSCHNEQKTKGKLLMTDTTSLAKGGSHGPIYEAGKSWESEMVRRVTLNPSSEKFMPPTGEPLSYQEIKLMEWWINSGASFNQPITAVEIPDDIKRLLLHSYNLDTKPKSFVELIKVEPLDPEVIAEIESMGFAVNPLASENYLLDVTPKAGAEIGEDAINSLLKAKEHITWLNLGNNKITDAHLAQIGTLTNLSRLRLEQNPISDAGVAHLSNLKNLESLNLYGTEVTDESLELLGQFKQLKNLYLWQSKVTVEGATAFMKTHPNMEVNMGFQLADQLDNEEAQAQ